MSARPAHGSSLPVERAFVVQFSADADVAGQRVTGRVEHVRSGRSRHFASLDELLIFCGGLIDGDGGTSRSTGGAVSEKEAR